MDDDGPQQVGYFDWLSYKEGDPLERGQGWCGGIRHVTCGRRLALIS